MRKYLEKGNLILFHGTLLDAIDKTTVPITVASLLDHMDWMSEGMINTEITHLLQKMNMKTGRIFWRTFSEEVHVAPLMWLEPVKVDDSDDRVGMYWSTWIAHVDKLNYCFEDRCNTNQSKGFLTDLITGAKMVTFPLWKPLVSSTLKVTGHANDMESFYKYQKEGYDAFREGLLHGRPVMMDSFPLKKGGNMVWLDVGGGTARNLEFFTPEIVKKYFKKIIIVDISASLLEMAQQRINKMKLGSVVSILECDYTDSNLLNNELKSLVGNVDVITMSYSFSMIPNQQMALVNSFALLKGDKEGYLAVTDFFLHGCYDDDLPPFSKLCRKSESLFHKWWFSNDHVHLLDDDDFMINTENFGTADSLTTAISFSSKEGSPSDQVEKVWDNRFRGAVPFVPFLKPYHGLLILRKK